MRPATFVLPLFVLCMVWIGIWIGRKIGDHYQSKIVIPRAIEEYGEVNPERLAAGALSQSPWMLSSGEEAVIPLSPEVDSFIRGYRFNETDATIAFGSGVYSTYGFLVDVDSGEVIATRSAYDKMYPASMTKVMTVLVAAKRIPESKLDDMYTFTIDDLHAAYNNDCSAVGYQEGEQATIRDLFYGTILPSGADCASGLACYVAGDMASFAELMNEEAKRLGIDGTTHFTNSVGYYDEENYTTAHDMAVIMKAALENDFCRQVLAERSYHGTPTPSYPGGVNIVNWFLRHIDKQNVTTGDVCGAKTGYVHEAGMCCVSYLVTHEGRHYILVTAKGSGKNNVLREHVVIFNTYVR